MQYIFVTPVTMESDIIPLPGIPSLMGVLEDKYIDCEYINLNSGFIEYLDNEKLKKLIHSSASFFGNEEFLKLPSIYSHIFNIKKNDFIKSLLWLKKNFNTFDDYKEISKTKKLMNNYSKYWYYINVLMHIKDINIPLLCSNAYFHNTCFNINPEDILSLYNNSVNKLKPFYEEKTEQIINKNPDITGIQITAATDLISGLFLAYELKQKNKNIHINIGGNFFEENYKRINNLKDLYGKFFDSISIGESTTTVFELVKYVNGELPIEEVTNLLYIKNNELKLNKKEKTENINRLPFQSFNGYKKEDYFLPEFVLPVRASMSNSCYWGKCIYCTCSGEKKSYRIMSVKRFVDEIEYLSKKYDTKFFDFWDNAMHPKYLSKVADLLIEKKLNIKYTVYARLEKEFTYDLLKKIKKSGCISIYWGLDSASQRICNYINKGINIKTAENVLKYSHKAGILNFIYLILGFPTETIAEMNENLNFVNKNFKNIDQINVIDKLLFLKNAILYENQEHYKKLIDTSPLFEEQKKEIINKINSKFKTELSLSSAMSQWQNIYTAKYGKFRFNIIKTLKYYYDSTQNKFLKKILEYFYRIQIFSKF